VPFSPVKVKATDVDEADGLLVIVMLDIWELVMFPLTAKTTVSPLSVVAVTFVAERVETGEVVLVGVGVGLGNGKGVAEVVGVRVEINVEVGEGVGAIVDVGFGVAVKVGAVERVGVGVGEGVGEAEGV
jgi:hypothetical protein